MVSEPKTTIVRLVLTSDTQATKKSRVFLIMCIRVSMP